MIIIYSQPTCVQCTATYRTLDKLDVAYQVVDLSVNEQALAHVLKLGYTQAPVVEVGDEHWSGFRPDLLKAAAERVNAA